MAEPDGLVGRIVSNSLPEVRGGWSCWTWQGKRDKRTGYGSITVKNHSRLVHRVAYEFAKGPIPVGLVIDHLCRNRACVNPMHLEAVTMRENLRRGDTLNAANLAKTHCPKNHPYSSENTHVSPDGRRYCRTCQRAERDKWTEKRRAARAAVS